MTEHRLYQLSYCKICSNRQPDFHAGLKCKLTNQLADFKASCHNYQKDNTELLELQSEMDNRIENSYPSRNLINRIILGSYLDDKQHRNTPRTRKKKSKFANSRSPFQGIFIVLGAFLPYFLYKNRNGLFGSPIHMDEVYNLLFLLSFLALMFYLGFIDKPKEQIEFKDEFLQYKKRKTIFHKMSYKRIYWREIINVRYLTFETNDKIIVGTISKGIQEIDITGLDTNPQEFINLVKEKAINVAQQRL